MGDEEKGVMRSLDAYHFAKGRIYSLNIRLILSLSHPCTQSAIKITMKL